MKVYCNYNYEVIRFNSNDGVRYGVKPIGNKGFTYITNDVKKAIDQADYYDTLPFVRTSDI